MAGKKKSTKAEIPQAMPSADNESWEAERHAKTLMDAHEIMQDPKKMKMAQKHIKKAKNSFKSFDEIKKYAQDKYGGVGGKSKDDFEEKEGEEVG